MKYPNFAEEKKLWKKGCKFVAGLDEAGRGPLAGPVVAAAVMVNPKFEVRNPKQIQKVSKFEIRNSKLKIRDSKQLSEKQREFFYERLTKHPDIEWGMGIVSEKIIDKINILEATKLAMERALKNLEPDFLLIDGNFPIKSKIPQKSVIGGDAKIFSCCAAGIIAKVTRDRIMKKYHKKYPQYGFLQHKGYPTKAHFANLEKFGPCRIHRRSFYPVAAARGRRQLSTA